MVFHNGQFVISTVVQQKNMDSDWLAILCDHVPSGLTVIANAIIEVTQEDEGTGRGTISLYSP